VPLMERLAALPFDAQPGERYVYGFNTDILGAVVEKASACRSTSSSRRGLFDPLKMPDSSFFPPAPEKRDRLATVYSAGPDGRIVRAPESGTGQGDYVDGPRACFGGGAGLLSTPDRLRPVPADAAQRRRTGRRARARPEDGRPDDGQPCRRAVATTANMASGLGFEVIEHLGRTGRFRIGRQRMGGERVLPALLRRSRGETGGVFYAQLIPAGGLDIQEKWRDLVYAAIIGAAARGDAGGVESAAVVRKQEARSKEQEQEARRRADWWQLVLFLLLTIVSSPFWLLASDTSRYWAHAEGDGRHVFSHASASAAALLASC